VACKTVGEKEGDASLNNHRKNLRSRNEGDEGPSSQASPVKNLVLGNTLAKGGKTHRTLFYCRGNAQGVRKRDLNAADARLKPLEIWQKGTDPMGPVTHEAYATPNNSHERGKTQKVARRWVGQKIHGVENQLKLKKGRYGNS